MNRKGIVQTWFALGMAVTLVACDSIGGLRGRHDTFITISPHAGVTTRSVGVPYGSGKEFFVSPNGFPGGNGKKRRPWDLATALRQPASVQPGSIIWLRGGIYRGQFTSFLEGAPEAPIVVRQYPGEHARIDGQTVDTNVLTINGANSWYWGFEVMNSHPSPQHSAGVSVGKTVGVKLINLIIHDHGNSGIISYSESVGAEIYGCLSYFNGRLTFNGQHAYGIYAQNQMGQKLIEENIFIHNFGDYTMHIYGSGQAFLNNFRFSGNVCFGGWALLGGGRKAENVVFDSNYFYGEDPDDGLFNLGWQTDFGPGVDNARLVNNYFMGGKVNFNAKNTNSIVIGNTFYGRLENFSPTLYPNNSYYVGPWPSAPPRPTGVQVFIRPNRYERGRANIIIYNWDGVKKVPLDMSGVLKLGDAYEVRDAQDYLGPAVESGIYSGGSIRLRLGEAAVASPLSVPADRSTPRHTKSEFGVFVVSLSGSG